MKPVFFASPAGFRAWLETHHDKEKELVVGFYKKGTGKPSITWPESVDEALCFGWIDGVRRRVDDVSYTIRFSPRRKRSVWSLINIKRVEELTREKRMRPAGLAAFRARTDDRTAVYSYEQRTTAALDAAQEKQFRSHPAAWTHFSAQPPGYRRLCAWYILSAKKEETRAKRLATLIAAHAQGKLLPGLERRPPR